MLGVYTRHDRAYPVVCIEQTRKQWGREMGETRLPLPAVPGQPARYDPEDERNGVADLLLYSAPFRRLAADRGGGQSQRSDLGGRDPPLGGRGISPPRSASRW